MLDVRYWVGFNRVYGVGPAKARALIDHFGDLETAWNADLNDLREAGLDRRAIENLVNVRKTIDLDQEIDRVDKTGARIVIWEDADYPPLLKNLPDAPPVLYIKGKLSVADREWTVAIVGTRRASAYGRQVAEMLATDLARNGITIVSGLARGIDAFAHEAALKAGGRTLGVLACGIDQVYPAEHAKLAAHMIDQGALLTEAPCGSPPEGGNFPARNRIISGLSLGTIVVEADEISGALITSDRALEQGREVFAVPGNIFAKTSHGTNNLLKEGATLVTSAQDVLEALNLKMVAAHSEARAVIPEDPTEAKLFALLSNDPTHIDYLVRESGLPVAQVSSTLALMELKGSVRQIAGMQYVVAREARVDYTVE
ncbi:MAG TPA: DNA-processing protein DprA [Anaerolineae bacterium]|nr:DNA-processing protein DprA [Anaerolineae bacterium]